MQEKGCEAACEMMETADKSAPLGEKLSHSIPISPSQVATPSDGGAPFLRRFLLALLIHMGVGVTFFMIQKEWNMVDCVYFTVLTITTIGPPLSTSNLLFLNPTHSHRGGAGGG